MLHCVELASLGLKWSRSAGARNPMPRYGLTPRTAVSRRSAGGRRAGGGAVGPEGGRTPQPVQAVSALAVSLGGRRPFAAPAALPRTTECLKQQISDNPEIFNQGSLALPDAVHSNPRMRARILAELASVAAGAYRRLARGAEEDD